MKAILLLLVIAQTSITLPKGVIIYDQPAINSVTKTRTLDNIEVKALYEVYRGDIYWIYVELPDGSKGFVPKVPGYVLGRTQPDTVSPPEIKLEDPCRQAQIDAKRDVQEGTWFAAGFLFGIFGVGAAYITTPNPPPERLLGKSPDYITLYTNCYQRYAKDEQVSNAAAGCIFWNALALLLIASGTI